jgi:hypothetical protein
MIYLAYDGSLGGDWVARYAMRLAVHAPEPALTLLHVEDEGLIGGKIAGKVEHLQREAQALGVELVPQRLPRQGDIAATLLRALPEGGEHLVVSGLRLRSRHHSYIAGTITEQLLRRTQAPLLALRVLQPGLLGAPRRALLPLSGSGSEISRLLPLLRLLLPDLDQLFLLQGVELSTFGLHHLSGERYRALLQNGVAELARAHGALRRLHGAHPLRLDGTFVLCDDWPGEIMVHTSRLKSRLLLLSSANFPLTRHPFSRRPLDRLLRGSSGDVALLHTP